MGGVALLVASAFATSVATAANYWKGVDGADLATDSNWSDNALPTAEIGYLRDDASHGASYTAKIAADQSFYSFWWDVANVRSVLDLGEHTLTLTRGDNTMTSSDFKISASGVEVVVTNGNFVSSGSVNICSTSTAGTGSRLVIADGATFSVANYDTSAGKHMYFGRSGTMGNNEIFVGSGASLNTRVLWVNGPGNTISISNGTVRAKKFDSYDKTTFHFAGSAPQIYQTGSDKCFLEDGECTYIFDIPAEGYTTTPIDLSPSGFTMPDDAKLVVNASAYARAGGGSLPLMSFRGTTTITVPDSLIARWNNELPAGSVVQYANRTLTLTVNSENHWAGVEGTDLADEDNWAKGTLPTSEAGYFGGGIEHGLTYSATLSKDQTLYRLVWKTSGVSSFLDLDGNTLTLNQLGASIAAADFKLYASDTTAAVGNGTLSIAGTVDICSGAAFTGSRFAVGPDATVFTQNNDSSAGKWTYFGKSGVDGGNEFFVGDNSSYTTRVFIAYGTNNTIAVSNGTITVGAYAQFGSSASDSITLRFSGVSPHIGILSTTHSAAALVGTPKLVFDIPAEGYSTVPLTRGNSLTIPDETEIVVNAEDYRNAGGGKLVLAQVTGASRTLTCSDTLLARWNNELAPKNCSVSYDSTAQTLCLKVKKPGLVIFVR